MKRDILYHKKVAHSGLLLLFTLLMLHFSTARAQHTSTLLQGYVSTEYGKPLPGAFIVMQQKDAIITQSVADTQGKFSLSISHFPTNALLVVRMLGYKEAKIKINKNKHHYTIILQEASEQLRDVVITGFLNKNKEGYSGSSYVIDKSLLRNQVNTNLLDLILRNTPGFELNGDIMNGSNPNKLPEMFLRGRSSFVEGDNTNIPLFILDGVEVDMGVIFNLRPSSVERVSVLKDAAATLFYGSKAANGVVVITSIPNRQGKLQADYTGQFQLSRANLSDYRLLNASEKLEYERLVGLYGDFKGKDKNDIAKQKSYYHKLSQVRAGINTNWLSIPLRMGLTQHHNLLLSGGNEQFRYSLTGGLSNTQGVMKQSNRHSTSLRVNLSYGDWSKLFLQYTGRIESISSDDVPYGKFSDYAILNPYDAPFDTQGNLVKELSFGKANPIYEQQLNSYIKHSGIFISNSLRFRKVLTPNWRIEGSLSYTSDNDNDETFYSPLSKRFSHLVKNKRGSFDILHNKRTDLSSNVFVVWNQLFGANNTHRIGTVLGVNLQAIEGTSDGYTAIGVLSDKADHVTQAIGFSEGSTPSGGRERSRLLGGYINAAYSYDNRYFIDFSYRREGSSKFGASNKYAPFGTIGVAWNLHNESFIPQRIFSLLKIRLSTGVVGKISFHSYQAQLSYRYSSNLIYNNDIGALPIAMVNTHLKWERTIKRNIGLDFGLFSDRLSGSLDIYNNITHDLVMTVAKPPHIGFKEARENLGQINNRGMELSLRGQLIKQRSFILNCYLTYAHNTNRIIKISEYLRNYNERNAKEGGRLPVAIYAEGESLTALKVMQSAGINPANGKEIFIKRDGTQTYSYDYRDRIVVGDTSPWAQGTWGFVADWKGIALSVSFNYRLGATLYNQTLATKVEGADPTNNVDHRAFFYRWKAPGDIVRYRNIAWNSYVVPSSRFIAKEYALEGSSLMLSYNIPQHICKQWKVTDIRISASTAQFFHLSTIKRERGLDYPFARIYELGLNIKL